MLKMPENHPNTHHLLPYWLSDSPHGIRRARRETPRGRICFKDLNEQPLLDAEAFCHWGTPAGNGYIYLQVRPGYRRLLTHEELNSELKTWPAKKFKKLRRTKRAGLTYESWVRPMLFEQGIRVCKRYDVIPCVEIKSPHEIEVRAVRMAGIVRNKAWDALYMALYKMTGIDRKAKAIIAVHEQFAILAHGEKRPPVLPPHTAIWGHFS